MKIIKVGSKIKGINGLIEIIKLWKDANGEKYVQYTTEHNANLIIENLYNFKKRITKNINKIIIF
jgi:hypothetical protein